MLMFTNRKFFILMVRFFLVACSHEYDWEKKEYWQLDYDKIPLSVFMAPTTYGERKLSSKGPYRPVLHYSTDCINTHIELKEIILSRGDKEELLPLDKFKKRFKQYKDDNCLTTFASEIYLRIDFEIEKQFEIKVRYIIDSDKQHIHESTLKVEAKYSSGKTSIPWFTT